MLQIIFYTLWYTEFYTSLYFYMTSTRQGEQILKKDRDWDKNLRISAISWVAQMKLKR